MPLTVGARLAHYNVTALIGEGGMGQVYRATDTQLNRDVALKVLPDAFAADPDRLARFQREAQVLASLNHPNIAQIHGIEKSADTQALVLELVEGPTLADRIVQGAIPIDEALPIAKQIAAALEAAHEAGVIHRDLKPANIKVREDGTVKVLDFGLAKALDTTPEGDPSQSPTLTAAATQMGVIMGTAAYMSPEQAKGLPADKRADIWGLGCVLFEMLTGERVFAGDDVSDTLAHVLTKEIDWTALPSAAAPALHRLLRRCLERDPKRRLRDIGDARFELDDPQPSSVSAPSAAVLAPVPHLQFWQRPVPALVVMLLVAVMTGLAVWSVTRPTEPAAPALKRFAIDLGLADPIAVSTVRVMPAVSPDGTQLVYAANVGGTQQLYLRTFDQLDAQPIAGSENAYEPFFSPDGEWVGFFNPYISALKRVSVRGGQALTLATCASANGATWLPDGAIVASCAESGLEGATLLRIPVAGGTLDPLLDADNGEVGHTWPRTLPGGAALLFTIVIDVQRADASRVAVLSLDTGEQHTVVEGGYNARYVPTGHLIFGRQGSLWGVPFDVDRLVTTGREELVLPEVELNEDYGSMALAVSGDGTLVYLPGETVGLDRGEGVLGWGRPVWVDRAGQATPTGEGRSNNALFPRLSPDNTRLATTVRSTEGRDVWVDDLERGTSTRLTNDGSSLYPAWSPDGARVSFGSVGVPPGLYSRAADGSGDRDTVVTGERMMVPHGWTPDGGAMLALEGQPGDYELWTVSLEGDRLPLLVGPGDIPEADLSPDGRWMAYGSDESGQLEVYLQRYPDLGDKVTVSSGGGRAPRWSPDGSELFYRNLAGDRMTEVEVETEPTLRVSRPEVLFEGRYAVGSDGGRNYDVSADGQRFVMIADEQEGDGEAAPSNATLIVVEHWFEELKRLVPTN